MPQVRENQSRHVAGSIGSAILSGVFSNQNSGGDGRSYEENVSKELQYLRKKNYEYEQGFAQVRLADIIFKFLSVEPIFSLS